MEASKGRREPVVLSHRCQILFRVPGKTSVPPGGGSAVYDPSFGKFFAQFAQRIPLRAMLPGIPVEISLRYI